MFTWEIMSSVFKNPSHFWLFKDPVVMMKENHALSLKDPINSDLTQFDHAQ